MCQQGADCKRTLCFFAHTPEQVKMLDNMLSCNTTACITPSVTLTDTDRIGTHRIVVVDQRGAHDHQVHLWYIDICIID
jgi:hypothetical protein